MNRRRAFVFFGLVVSGLSVQAATTNVQGEETKAKIVAVEKGVKGNAFGSKNWKPAPPAKKVVKAKSVIMPSAVAPMPSPPAPPPLPFIYIGRMVDGPSTTVFLANQQRNLAVKVGDTIDNVYRVEKIADSSMTLTYLPLNAQQQLSLGGPR